MCAYCATADFIHRHLLPDPMPPWPQSPWDWSTLTEVRDLLRRIKALEDKVGACPAADPAKVDFLDDIRKRLDELERRAGA